jgi:hypothetical protein
VNTGKFHALVISLLILLFHELLVFEFFCGGKYRKKCEKWKEKKKAKNVTVALWRFFEFLGLPNP